MAEDYRLICTGCYAVRVEPPRLKLGYRTCMDCGDKQARATTRTIAPMHKSNYVLITNPEDLKGLNNKGGLIK
jgi:hypothetical protein